MTDVKMPDGTIIKNVPEGITQAELMRRFSGEQPSGIPPLPTGQTGLLEAALGFGSQIPASIAGGISGLLSLGSTESRQGAPSEAFDRAAGVTEDIARKFTFEPRTEIGQDVLNVINKPFELFEKGTDIAGQFGADVTDSSAVGAGIKTVLGAAPLALGFKPGPKGIQFKRQPQTRRQVLAQEANRNGYVVETGSAAEGAGGIAKVRQEASHRNQQNTNKLVREEFDLAEGTPLLPEEFARVRSEASQAYNVLRDQGEIPLRTSFRRDVSNAVKDLNKVEAEFPGISGAKDLFSRVEQLLKKDKVDADAGVTLIQIARENADRAFLNKEPTKGRAWKSIADSMEGAFEAELLSRGESGLVRDFRASRQDIAKSYTAENALVGENISAPKLAASKAPLTGNLKLISDFGKNFKKVARVFEDSPTPFSALSFLSGGLGIPGAAAGAALGGPLGALIGSTPAILTALRPVLRSRALSDRGQSLATRPPITGQIPGLVGAGEAANRR